MKIAARVLYCFLLSPALLAQEKNAAPPSFPFHISGTVVDAITGEPLGGSRVEIVSASQRNSFRTLTTEENGHFLFENVAPGKYTLYAQRRGYIGEAYNQHDVYDTAIAVGPNLDPGDLIFRLHQECSISGNITDEHDEPVRDADVILLEKVPSELSGLRVRSRNSSDDLGHFHFGHLKPGKYFLLVIAQPWYMRFVNESQILNTLGGPDGQKAESSVASLPDVVYAPTYYPGSLDAVSASAIVLVPGERLKADLTLQPLPALHVAMPFASGDSQQQIWANVEQHFPGAVTTPVSAHIQASQGLLEISGLAPGHYHVQLNLPQQEGGKAPPERSMELDVAASGEVRSSEVSTNAKVEGTATSDTGKKFTEMGWVNLRNRTSGQTMSAEISTTGEFSFGQGLPPGTYEVTAFERDFFLGAMRATGAKATGSTVQIGDAGTVTLALTLTKGVGKVEGLALKDGKPFAGAMIVLVPQDSAHNFELFRRDQSDSDGTFTLNNTLPGKYTVLALENGWELEVSDAAAFKPYMAGGTAVQVGSGDKVNVKVKVQ